MMIANYHTHTYHCHHASGKPEDYVINALQNGLEELGFSDHVPCPFSNGHRSGFRMDVEETETYVNEILELREKYRGKLNILIGYEAEYYPREFEGMLDNIRRYPLDYLICGQHFTHNEYDGEGNCTITGDPARVTQFVDQVTEAMSTGVFTYIAHPDMMCFTGDEVFYKEEVLRLCAASVKYDVPLEYNCLGMEGRRHYPSDKFWKIVSQSGAKAVIGSDAHEPDRAGNQKSAKQAEENLARFGIVPLLKPELKDPRA